MKIEILYVPGCPNLQPAAELVQKVLSEEGVRADVRQVPVADEGIAAALPFAGSPTVLVDGRDVEPTDLARRCGLSCRWYAATASGVPSRDMLLRAIRESGFGECEMKRGTVASAAAVISSALALSCCLPLGFLGAAGAAGAALLFKSAQPWLLVLSVGFLALGFFEVYRPARCGVERSRLTVILLWTATVLVAVIVFFPQVVAGWLADLMG